MWYTTGGSVARRGGNKTYGSLSIATVILYKCCKSSRPMGGARHFQTSGNPLPSRKKKKSKLQYGDSHA